MNQFPNLSEVASSPLGNELKAAAEAAASSSPYPEFHKGLYCAFCLIPLKEEDAKKCASCSRRVYCSRECQAADWKAPKEGKPATCTSTVAAVYGQGHKNWCSIPCGEEGRDWCLQLLNGKPGLVALRDIPAFYRIIVEGYQNNDEPGYMNHPGLVTIMRYATTVPQSNKHQVHAKMRLQRVQGRSRFGFRTHFGNHSCDANAYLTWDTEYRVMILVSIKEIKAGEEICFQYEFLQFNDMSRRPPNLREREDMLMKSLDHECKSDCVCKDRDLRRALLDLWAAKDSMQNQMQMGRLEEAVRIGESFPALAERAKLPPQQVASLDMLRFGLEAARGLPASNLLPFVRKVIEFREKVYHPQNKSEVLQWKSMEQNFLENGETLIRNAAI